jgi:hypothetical protein
MNLQAVKILLCALALALLVAPGAAEARKVLSVNGARVSSVEDPFAPSRAASAVAPRANAAATPTRKTKAKRHTRGQKAVSRALLRARRLGRISRATYARYRRLYSRSLSVRKKLRGARGRELGSVIATLEAIARRRQLVPSRMPALFLILKRNLEYWPRRPFPANRGYVTFRGSQLLFEYYRGAGLQLQPLANFKRANQMHGACVKATGAPCRPDRLRSLLEEMTKLSASRGGFRAWEYYFSFGGGRPPWISGMATATGIQGYARASRLLGDRSYLTTAQEALRAFETRAPTGVMTKGPFGGVHYLQYSFAPRLFIINAFVQALNGLYDFGAIAGDARARQLFAVADPEARAEVPANDTGDWSTYSFRGRESTPEYHELLREVLASLCDRTHTPVYCVAASNFRRYATEPAELALLGPLTVVKDQPTRVRFSLSKLSAVQLTITRDGRTALDKVVTFRRGTGSFGWTPKAAGTYSVRLGSKELRTGRELRTRVSGVIQSLP